MTSTVSGRALNFTHPLTHSLTPEIVRVREVDLQKRDEPTPDLEIPKNVHSFIRAFVTE